MTSSLISRGFMPWRLAYRARRDNPKWLRRPDRRLNSFAHSGLKLPPVSDRLRAAELCRRQEIGSNIGEAFSRETKRERVDGVEAGADRREVEHDACRLIAEQICNGFTADRRSRLRVAESLPERSSAASMDARVIASSGEPLQEGFLVARVTGLLLSGRPGAVSGGQGAIVGDIREA